jgi:signal transduction histidine kinase
MTPLKELVATRPIRILNVDDNEISRYVRTLTLQTEGYLVSEAASGQQALERLASENPAVVLLDVNLPDMHGFEVCRRIKEAESAVRPLVVHISATHQLVADRARGLESGADGYLIEPVEPELLNATIRSLLRLRRAEESLIHSEERRRIAQAVAGMITWEWDLDSNTVTLSEGASVGEHVLPLEEYLASVHPDERRQVEERMLEAVVSGVLAIEYRTVSPDGVRWVTSRAKTFSTGATSPRMIGATLDITDKKRAADELECLVAQLGRSNADLQDFAFSAGHDLREPLRMISLYADLLQSQHQTSLDADGKQCLQFVSGGVERMSRLLDDLLAFAKAGSEFDPPDTPVDFNAVARKVVKDIDQLIETSHASITLTQLPPMRVHSSHLYQLLLNLMSNAIKYRGTEPPRIHVSASRLGNRWRIAVRDNGIGIDPKHSSQVFRLFKRLHGDERPGSGMGLAICKRIVERYGGEMWVESAPGSGSTFHFTIPDSQKVATAR